MEKIRLFTDTDTDITPEIAKKYGYSLISMPYSYNGTTVYPYSDSDSFDFHAFYNMLRQGTLPTTSAISEGQYLAYFEPFFALGEDILYVHFSAAMTVTFDNMHRAVHSLQEKYPERKFYEIDTKGITLLSYAIASEIGEMVLSGASVDEIMDWAKDGVDRFAIRFFADDLKFFARSGRVGGLVATMGSVLGVRPIIYMSTEGKMESIGKERGRSNAMNRLLAAIEELGDHAPEHKIYIGHTDAPELAKEIENMLKLKYGSEIRTETVCCNPTAGSHCGPNGVGVAFRAIHR